MEGQANRFKSIITDFRPVRPWSEVLVFYFSYLALGLVLGIIAGFIAVLAFGAPDQNAAQKLAAKTGVAIGAVYSAAIYIAILRARKAWKNPWYFVGLLVVPVAGAYAGTICGLIPSALALGMKPKQ